MPYEKTVLLRHDLADVLVELLNLRTKPITEGDKPDFGHVLNEALGKKLQSGLLAALDEELVEAIDLLRDPADWIAATKAKRWGTWHWPVETLNDIQPWGDRHCCRFILVSERREVSGEANPPYHLVLYIAPKPNRRETGLDAASIGNRDRGMEGFSAWLEGYLSGRGLIFPGESLPR